MSTSFAPGDEIFAIGFQDFFEDRFGAGRLGVEVHVDRLELRMFLTDDAAEAPDS